MLPVKAGAAVPAVFKTICLSSLEGTAKASPDEVCSVLHLFDTPEPGPQSLASEESPGTLTIQLYPV